ncbi:DUF1302 domain-containing protein [Microbulbifer hainanensis]|uniref:DUF1302 domain-containing protein n=1 Tax=Microbulbifer hainanensis TaxID=2735675 RepID=UPI001867CD0E|nr:DUF1302 domain-containing protein [Microbulbifer hainanensis]
MILFPQLQLKPFDHFPRRALSRAIAALAPALLFGTAAEAKEFQLGAIKAEVHGGLTAGAQWMAEEPNPDFINQGNADLIGFGSAGEFNPNLGRDLDDGRLNFRERGDVASTPLVFSADMNLAYQNFGLNLRGNFWYDYTLENHKVDFGSAASGYGSGTTLGDSRRDVLQDYQLEAYAYGNFKVGERDLHFGVGSKTLKWGEALFFPNGINAVNPYDVAALRMPGTDLRLSVPMAYGKFAVSDSLTLETFYQLAWRPTVLDGCGTAFSAYDYVADGCVGAFPQGPNDAVANTAQLYIDRGEDRKARDDGQFGLAVKYKVESLNTEFGAYGMNIHSREPFASLTVSTHDTPGTGWRNPLEDPDNLENNGNYFIDYPEDIRIYGLSFHADLFQATQLFGELSYRPNQPVQLATGDLIPAFASSAEFLASVIGQQLTLGEDAINAAPGSVYEGYDRREISQLSLGAIQPIPNVLGSRALVLVAEAGMKYMNDLPGLDERRYNKMDTYGTNFAHNSAIGCAVGVPVEEYQRYACSADGYTTELSWGYRLRAQLLYPDLVKNLSVNPYMMFGQDVNGWSWDRNFVEGRQMGQLGVSAEYDKRYTADLHWSGSGNTHLARTDRDYLALTVGVKF